MSKYFIDRNKAVNALNEAQIEGTDTYKGLGLAKQIIDNLPCEDRPKGEWLETFYDYECSNCHIIRAKGRTGKYDFCPGCGADMRGGKE